MLKGQDWWPTVAPEQALQQMTIPECDISADPDGIELSETVNAFLFGRTPNYAPYIVTQMQWSLFFPRGMATDALFPSTSSVYTDPDTGILYESPCYTPNAEAVVESVVCPSPFLSPMTDELRGKANCIKPCPVQAYSEDEYHVMWIISSAPACVGLLFNIYMKCHLFFLFLFLFVFLRILTVFNNTAVSFLCFFRSFRVSIFCFRLYFFVGFSIILSFYCVSV